MHSFDCIITENLPPKAAKCIGHGSFISFKSFVQVLMSILVTFISSKWNVLFKTRDSTT